MPAWDVTGFCVMSQRKVHKSYCKLPRKRQGFKDFLDEGPKVLLQMFSEN